MEKERPYRKTVERYDCPDEASCRAYDSSKEKAVRMIAAAKSFVVVATLDGEFVVSGVTLAESPDVTRKMLRALQSVKDGAEELLEQRERENEQ